MSASTYFDKAFFERMDVALRCLAENAHAGAALKDAFSGADGASGRPWKPRRPSPTEIGELAQFVGRFG